MKMLKTLQEQFKQGKITKEQYAAKLKELLDGEYIDQEEHDEYIAYDPEEDKPQFTQADVDRIVAVKATKMVRSELKKAGIELAETPNKDLLPKVAELLKAATSGKKTEATDVELERLKLLESKVPGLESRAKDLTIENAVLKGLGGNLRAVNPVQVVRALKLDYMDLVEIDDESGEATTKSVETALKRIAAVEPNLFESAEGGDDKGGQGAGFRGKGPGGGTGGGAGGEQAALAKKEEARQMLRNTGIVIPEQK